MRRNTIRQFRTRLIWLPLGLTVGLALVVIASLAHAAPPGYPGVQPAATTSPTAPVSQPAEGDQPAGERGSTDRRATPGTAGSTLQVTPEELTFYKRRRAPFRPLNQFHFQALTVTVFNTGGQPVSVQVLGRQLNPGTTTLATAATGPLPLQVARTDKDKTTAVSESETLSMGAKQSITFEVKPTAIRETGVYSGSVIVRLVQTPPSGNAEDVIIPVKVVTTDGPGWPFLIVFFGVLVTTSLLNWRTTGRQKTILTLRAAGLKRRLGTWVADARDKAFSERLAARTQDRLREAQRKWQEQDLPGAQTELDEIETLLENYAEAFALINDAEGALAYGREQFLWLGGGVNRQLAGEGLLQQARVSLSAGDTTNAQSFAGHALKVYGQALGLYTRLKDQRGWIEKMISKHPVRLNQIRGAVEMALRRADELIDSLTLVDETGKTDDAERGLTRVGYWSHAFEVVADAIDHVPSGCSAGQRQLEKALDLLSTTTVENAQVPRSDDHTDNLQKAEAAARTALKLCEAEPLLADLALWFPENDGSEAWQKYAEARKELDKDDGDADRVVTLARQAAGLHRLTELNRVAWRWAEGDARHTALADAHWAHAVEDWEDALRRLPWEESYQQLAEQLTDELRLAAECHGPGVDELDRAKQAGLNWREAIRAVQSAMKQGDVQTSLVNHYVFELELAPVEKGEAGWDNLQVAQTNLQEHKPFAALGALKRALDLTPIQEQVARALLAEAELVNHQAGDPGWDEMTQARHALDDRKWTRGFWMARFAWLDSRRHLADYYIAEADKVIQSDQDPGYADLQAAQVARDNECWARAARHAREAWRQARPKLAVLYVTRAKDEVPEWADAAKADELLGQKHYDDAFTLALQALATHAVRQAEGIVKPEGPGWEVLREAQTRRDAGCYAQALRAANAALEAARAAEAMKGISATDYARLINRVLIEDPSMAELFGAADTILEDVQSGNWRLYVTDTMSRPQRRQLGRFETLVRSGVPLPDDLFIRAAKEAMQPPHDEYQRLEQRLEALKRTNMGQLPWRDLFKEAVDATELLDKRNLAETENAVAQAERVRNYLMSKADLLGAIPANVLKQRTTDGPVGAHMDRTRQAIRDGDTSSADRELLTGWRLALRDELDALDVPGSWTEVVSQMLSEAGRRIQMGNMTEARDGLAQAAALIGFLKTEKKSVNDAEENIIAPDDPGYPLLQEARAAFAQRDTGKASSKLTDAKRMSGQWRRRIKRDDAELSCRNVQLQETRPPGRHKSAPPIDEETSVDDAFHFEVRIEGAASEQLANYAFEWFISEKEGEWSKREPVPGRAQNRLVVKFDNPGCKGVGVNVEHKEVKTRKLPRPANEVPALVKYFEVRDSRYSTWQRTLNRNSVLEVGLVVVIASLIGLNAKFYATGVESFGSPADYLTAALWGATAKYGEEAFKSLPQLLASARSAVGSVTSPTEG